MTTLTMQPILDQARVPGSVAGWRNVIGEVAEELAAERLLAHRLSTGSGNWYCPDLRADNFYAEVKAVGLSRNVIIYRVRLEKDRQFVRHSRMPLCYVLVLHDLEINSRALELRCIENKGDARFVIEFTARIWVILFCYVDAICATMVPRILNHKYKPSNGWCQRGYELGGYSVPAKRLIAACPYGRIQ